MLRAIRAVGSGEALFSPSVAVRLVECFANTRLAAPPQVFPELSVREVLDLIAQGRKNADIAEHFVLSEKTVRNHVSNVVSKLQVADRTQAIILARSGTRM